MSSMLRLYIFLVAAAVIVGCGRSPVAPTPVPPVVAPPPPTATAPVTPPLPTPPPVPIPATTFNGTFWSQLIYNAYSKPGSLSERRSWVLPTRSPNVYILTTRLPDTAVASMRQAIPGIVEAVTGVPYAGTVHAGGIDGHRLGWITIRSVARADAPDWVLSAACGAALIGADPGEVWLIDAPDCTTDRMRARLLAHELGHALGLYHVPDADAVMKQFSWVTTFSAAEQFHGELAYQVGRGAAHCGDPASCRSFLTQPPYYRGADRMLD